MKKVVFIRHGQSEWNLANRFTGWEDVDLSEQGVKEAQEAGRKIKEAGIHFDVLYTSVLKRAIKTAHIVLEETDQLFVPEYKSWRLNERHYGALQGLNKAETAEKYGDEQVHIWRRSYDVLPLLLEGADYDKLKEDPRYASVDQRQLPQAESLEVTLKRTLPFWDDAIAPALLDDKTVLVAAHGNSLRSLVKYLDNLSKEEVLNLEIPTGSPLVYELNDDLTVSKKYYL